ncbi:MAG: bifunctional nuclease family protein [Firmicutes bacterium]|jgi:hypothetical protein|nr:bifunctional nuclease family protein [Bacillota bacterium]
MLEVRLADVRVDLSSNTPVILLEEKLDARRALPVYIGAPEATAIALAIQHVPVSRPMSHDLMLDIISALGASLEKIVVTEERDETYYAEMYLKVKNGNEIVLSCRPSDAIALATRCDAQMYVADELMDQAGIPIETETESTSEDGEELVGQFRAFLDRVNPEDFENL